MAKRFTDTELWDKEWFMKLSPKLKCLVKMVRDKCDLSGVWSPNWIIANTYIGEKVTEEELLSINNGLQFEKNENGKIICLDFIRFQYGKLSDKSPVHRKILSILEFHKIEYKHPIDRVQEEEEEEEEEDKDKSIEGRKKEFFGLVAPFREKYEAKMIDEFLGYWTEKSPKGTKMRFEKQIVFDVGRRLGTWFGNVRGSKKTSHKSVSSKSELENEEL